MDMRAFANTLFTQHPTRMWRKEKDSFLHTCREMFAQLGYAASEITVQAEKNIVGFTSHNLLIGRPDADILFTAHYDTPGYSGTVIPFVPSFFDRMRNQFFLAFIIAFVAGMLGLRFFTDWHIPLGYRIAVVVGICLLFTATLVVKNKRNHNDNTSGVLGVMRLASLIANDTTLREKCAFVLFDHEEIMPGCLGSGAFEAWRKKTYPGKMVQVINLDCIGVGEVLRVQTRKPHALHHKAAAFFTQQGYDVCAKRSPFTTSDHESFDTAFSLLFERRSQLGTLYIPNIHTPKDIECDLEKIEALCTAVYELTNQVHSTINTDIK